MTKISDETNIEKIEHKSKKNMAIGTILGYLAVFVSVAYGLFLTPEIIKFVGASEYGLYGLSSSIVNLFLLDFGLGAAANTYLARLRAKGDKEGVERFTSGIFKIYLILNVVFIVVIAALVLLAPYIFAKSYGTEGVYNTTESIRTLQYLFIIVGSFTIISLPCSIFNSVINTYEKFGIVKLLDIIQKLLYLGLTILSIQLKWQINGSGIIPIVLINVTTTIGTIGIRLLYMRFYLNVHFNLRKGISKQERKEVLSFSGWGFIVAMCMRLVITVAPFILAVVSDDTAVYIFSIVTTIETYIYTFGNIITSFFMAKITRNEEGVSEEEKRRRLQAIVEKVGKIQYVIIACIVFGFASIGREFISFWLKEEANPVMYWAILMISGYEIFHIPQMIFQDEMYAHGKIKYVAFVSICKVIINIPLCFGLAYFFTRYYGNNWVGAGAFGAAIAIMTARVAEVIIGNITYRKHLGFSLSHFYKTVYIRGGITGAISLGVGIGMSLIPYFESNPGFKFLINGVVFVIVYAICTFTITFTKEERHYYWNAILEILHIKSKKKAVPQVEEKKEEETSATE